MTMPMSPTFTAADRRKRIATYGKSSRPTTKYAYDDDTPSPERPRKQTSALGGGLKKPSGILGTGSALGNVRTNPPTSPARRDVFDVPSDDDELAPPRSPAPKKKLQPKHKAPADVFDVPSSGDEAHKQLHKSGKVPQPLRKLESGRPPPTLQKKQPRRNPLADAISSEDPIVPVKRRAKTPQASSKSESSGPKQPQPSARPAVKSKVTSRATTPAPTAPQAPETARKLKSTSTLPVKKPVAKPAVKPVSDLDIFDVPLSDNETKPKNPRPKRTQLSRPKPVTKAALPTSELPPDSSGDSDGSNSSKKRKRQASFSSTATGKDIGVVERRREQSVPQRSRKYQKKEDGISPGHASRFEPRSIPVAEPKLKEPEVNKPKRTRARAALGPPRAPVAKGQSSPAKLHGMLAMRSASKPSPVAEAPEEPAAEDETMYDIQDVVTPVARAVKTLRPGSVTPREQTLLNNLLGDSSDSTTPALPSISKLQLTSRKPSPIIAGLTRSSSDIPQTVYTRKTRLIDTLKEAAEISGEDSESDEETEEDMTEIPPVSAPSQHPTTYGKKPCADTVDTMEVDSRAADPQASQPAAHATTGAKVTYAKQRSYLEGDLEEELFLSMDLDDLLNSGAKKNAPVSEDDDDPASQAQGIHDLRRQGQLQRFHLEAQNAIDDIAGTSGMQASGRRSALLEFCTRMADKQFVQQLFDSALGGRFLACLSSADDIIFGFAAAVAVAFIAKTEPEYSILDQVYRSGITATLTRLLDASADIREIAKQRKTNLSRIAQESVAEFRTLIQGSEMWSSEGPEKISPQLVALKSLEHMVLGLRKAGSTEAFISEDVVIKLLGVASEPCEHIKSGGAAAQDTLTASLAFSILESVSVSKKRQATWSNDVLGQLADLIPVLFQASGTSPIKLAMRLCMNLTNNKPKACEIFAGPTFVKPLVGSISQGFAALSGELDVEQRAEVMESLILSLGAMINLAEFSDRARASVVKGDDELIDGLTKVFLEGSERAAQADSMEESQSSVTIGYLTVLLGNLCLNDVVRSKVCSRLPARRIDMLVEQIREFVRYNERVDRETSQFEGEEGRETWKNFTRRLMLVVERLEKTDG